MSDIGYEDIELEEIPHGPSPVIQVIRKAAVRLGLDEHASISESLLPQATKVDAIFQTMIGSAAWLQPNGEWQYSTFPGGMVSDSQLAWGWGMTTHRDAVTPGIQSNCAFYAKFLQFALGAVGIEDTELVSARSGDDLFVTRQLGSAHPNVTGTFRCIDAGVSGNVRREHVPFAVEARCCFSAHVALRVGNRVYDPTLQATYSRIEDCIDFWVWPDPLQPGVYHSRGVHPQRRLTRLPNERVSGFGAAYVLK